MTEVTGTAAETAIFGGRVTGTRVPATTPTAFTTVTDVQGAPYAVNIRKITAKPMMNFGRKGGEYMNKRMRRAKEQRYIERQERKVKTDATSLAIDVLEVIPVYILHEIFGMGHDRLIKYIKEFDRLTCLVADRKVKLETLASCIEMETGLMYKQDEWTDKGKKRKG